MRHFISILKELKSVYHYVKAKKHFDKFLYHYTKAHYGDVEQGRRNFKSFLDIAIENRDKKDFAKKLFFFE